MERRADRELPGTLRALKTPLPNSSSNRTQRSKGPSLTDSRADIASTTFRWRRSLPLFAAVIIAAAAAIFNYQKSSSPIVAGTLYALRTNARARDLLGDEIYFANAIPLIRGEMNQLRGRINIRFGVKGMRGTAVMRFASFRPSARGVFETTEWSLETPDGRRVDLLEDGDPLRSIGGGVLGDLDDEEDGVATRGFRQMPK